MQTDLTGREWENAATSAAARAGRMDSEGLAISFPEHQLLPSPLSAVTPTNSNYCSTRVTKTHQVLLE